MSARGARGRSPGRAGGSVDVVDLDPVDPVVADPVASTYDYKGAFVFGLALAIFWAMRDQTPGVLVMCAASFVMAIACHACFLLKDDAEHGGMCVFGFFVVVVLCAHVIHDVKVYTSAKEAMQYASVKYDVLKRVLQEVPVCLEAANECLEMQERTAYLRTLSWHNVTHDNITLAGVGVYDGEDRQNDDF
jgi:hypothetical protein